MDFADYTHQYYLNNPNYKVIDNPDASDPGLAVIYFSSVGLFSEKNYQTRLENDYYEFHRNRVERAGRHIYIRDVALAVYTIGINPQINSIPKVLELLKKLTEGYRVVTLGVSGGGYMAMLAGTYLNADYAVSFSGVVHFDHVYEYFTKLPGWINWQPGYEEYYNIVSRIKDGGLDIFQFDAGRCQEDIDNALLMRPVKGTHLINVDYSVHAGEVDAPAVGQIINMNKSQLLELFKHFKGRMISKRALNFQVLPWKIFLSFYFKKLRKNFFRVKFGKKGSLIVVLGIPLVNTTGNPEF